MRNAIDFAGYQAVWFAAVLGAGRELAWPGVACATAFAAWHLAVAPDRARVVALAAAGLACGLLLDGTLVRAGWIDFRATWPPAWTAVGAPPWILALWAVFPLTLTRSLAVLQRHRLLAIALGAVGAPLAYASAARMAQAWSAQVPMAQLLGAIGLGWAVALPVLARVARGPKASAAAAMGVPAR
ncbi:DUF2878 domain-containing protein [Lysobacter xanthus]